AVFRAAGLDPATFHEVDPQGVPVYPYDSRRAWKGPHPGLPKTELTLDVAWWKGRVTRARLVYPWRTEARAQAPASFLPEVRTNGVGACQAIAVLFVTLLARHNWKQNRADRRGAWWVGFARLLMAAGAWIGWTHPVESEAMFQHFLTAAGDWLLSAFIIWAVY